MISLSTNAGTHLLRDNKVGCHHSKQHPARRFDKDLRSLLLRLYSKNADSIHFQNGLEELEQTRSRLRHDSCDVNTSRHSVSYVFLEITKQREEMGIDDPQCLLLDRPHLPTQVNRNTKHAIQSRSSYIYTRGWRTKNRPPVS